MNGWGLLKFASSGQSAEVPVQLQHVTVPFVSNDKCDRAYSSGAGGRITDNMICAGLDQGGKDTCQVGVGTRCLVEIQTEIQGTKRKKAYARQMQSFKLDCVSS